MINLPRNVLLIVINVLPQWFPTVLFVFFANKAVFYFNRTTQKG